MSGTLLVIAPHPDDDILGAGGIMARAARDLTPVAVIFATDGAASDPGADPPMLRARRRAEAAAGLARLLGFAPATLFLDQPDGALAAGALELGSNTAPERFLRAHPPGAILVTDPADGHPDHKAAFGLAVRLVAAGHGQSLAVMPISQRVDGVFDPAPFTPLPLTDRGVTKAAALACHASQIAGPGFTLPETVRADFCHTEYLRAVWARAANAADTAADAVAPAHFDALFARSPDPWGYDATPYERDRFARTIAGLGGRRYARALELGCANGALTQLLAPHCELLLASDASTGAIAAARARLGAMPGVRLEQRRMPGAVPAGPFDLIVLSDMLYYLGLDGVIALMPQLVAAATPDARLVVTCYLGETDTRLTGEMAAEAAIALLPGWRRAAPIRTDRLRIDVLDRA